MKKPYDVVNRRALHPCGSDQPLPVCRFPLCSCDRIDGVWKDARDRERSDLSFSQLTP